MRAPLRPPLVTILFAASLVTACEVPRKRNAADAVAPPPPPHFQTPDSVADPRAEERFTDAGGTCRYVGTTRPQPVSEGGSGNFDSAAVARGIRFRCALRAHGPYVRITVSGEGGVPDRIVIYPSAAPGRPVQTLTFAPDDAISPHVLVGEDLNRDGWTDLKALVWSGSAGAGYHVYMYDPRRARFVADTVLAPGVGVEPLAGARPCVESLAGAGAGSATDQHYCWEDGRWVLGYELRDETSRIQIGGRELWVRRRREYDHGRLRVEQTDTTVSP